MMKTQTSQTIRPRILVADDSQITRKSVHRILSEDFEVCEVEGGREALALLKTDRDFHTLFVDIMMPELDGFEVLKTLRESKDNYLRHMPVIMMTSDEDSATLRRKAVVLGATDFITKPFDSLILKTRARAHARVPDDYVAPAAKKVELVEDTAKPAHDVLGYSDFHVAAEQAINNAYENQQSVSLLYLKVDAFEALCQITGKQEADSVMLHTGKLISSQLRQKDLIASTGDGNFVILMPETSATESKEMTKGIYRAVRKSHPDLGNMRINVSLSGGMITSGPENNGYNLEKLENIASGRLNKAVEEGGNQLVYADLKKRKLQHPQEIELLPDSTIAKEVSLLSALESLKDGNIDGIDVQLPRLLKETFPLLVVANTKLKLGIDDALKRIQSSLEETTA